MKIKAKLGIGFSLMLLLMVGITSYGYERLTQMKASMDHFYDNRFEKVSTALAVRGEVNAAGRIINDIVIGDQDPKLGVQEISSRLKDVAERYDAMSTLDLSLSEREALDELTTIGSSYGRSLANFVSLVNEDRIEEAKDLYTKKLRNDQRQLIDSLDGLVKVQQGALKQEIGEARAQYGESVQTVAMLTAAGLLLGLVIVLWVFPSITRGLLLLGKMADRFGKGKLRGFNRFEVKSRDELGELAVLFKQIALDLHAKNEREAALGAIQQRQARLDAQLARVPELLSNQPDLRGLAQSFMTEFAPVIGASFGTVYLTTPASGGQLFELHGTYAGDGGAIAQKVPKAIRRGEGLVGQCAQSGKPILLDDVPDGYAKISSGLGSAEPKQILLNPIAFENEVIGVAEIGTLKNFSADDREIFFSLCDKFAAIVHNISSRERVEELLRESQAMTEELQVQSEEMISQQEELRQTNDKLEGQRNHLKISEERLKRQQEELEHANRELTVKTVALEEQIDRAEAQNHQIAQANAELERRTLQLALTSKYKSEFLANMSHELRTPLNSLLILSEFLSDDADGSLTDKQREYTRTIHESGNDLLKMIDEILDLAKVDAGRMDITPEWTMLGDLKNFLEHAYSPFAERKNLGFVFERSDDVPEAVWTDGHRLKQIMRNLLSNAFKFTERGSVTVEMRRPSEAELRSAAYRPDEAYVAFAVRDTGIGISAEKSEVIFEAFRQADGTTSRKYGGTGLGLTISREMARLLQGWIALDTEPGKGSVFALVLPERMLLDPDEPSDLSMVDQAAVAEEAAIAQAEAWAGDGGSIVEVSGDALREQGDEAPSRKDAAFENKKILLADDDIRNVFALSSVLESRKMKVVYAENGADALGKLEDEGDVDLVLMDIMMPEMDGYEAMKRIRENRQWQKLPIIALTAKAMKDDRNKCIEAGASDYLAKPVNTDQLLSLMRVWLHR